MSSPSGSDQVQSSYNDWTYNVNETNYLRNVQLQQQEQKLNTVLGMMATLPASVAFNLLIPAVMALVSAQDTTQMSIQASNSNAQGDVLNLINITQEDDNYLASNSQTYINACNDPTGTTTNSDGSTTSNQDIINEYNDKYNEANEAQSTLQTMFEDTSNTSSPYYGWCDDNYASSMIDSIQAWQSATQALSQPAAGTTDPHQYESQGTPQYYYATNLQSYANAPISGSGSDPTDPTVSPYSADVNNLTSSLNTETSSNNSIQSQIQGLLKAMMSTIQQYEGSTKSSGKSIIDEKNYWVQSQRSS